MLSEKPIIMLCTVPREVYSIICAKQVLLIVIFPATVDIVVEPFSQTVTPTPAHTHAHTRAHTHTYTHIYIHARARACARTHFYRWKYVVVKFETLDSRIL